MLDYVLLNSPTAGCSFGTLSEGVSHHVSHVTETESQPLYTCWYQDVNNSLNTAGNRIRTPANLIQPYYKYDFLAGTH